MGMLIGFVISIILGKILCYDRKKLKGHLPGKDAFYKESSYEKSTMDQTTGNSLLGYGLETPTFTTAQEEQKNQPQYQTKDYLIVWANIYVNNFYLISLMLRFTNRFRDNNPKFQHKLSSALKNNWLMLVLISAFCNNTKCMNSNYLPSLVKSRISINISCW